MDRTDWIGETYTSSLGRDLLFDLSEIGSRLAASEGEREGHDRLAEAFEECGVRDVHDQEFAIPRWERGSSQFSIDVPRERSFDVISLPGSPAGEAAGEIVHLGYGLPEDFERSDLEGTIVVARSDAPAHHRWMHRREKYFRAYEAGAAAFVYQNHVPGCLPPTGSLGGGIDVMGPLPAIGISTEEGERLAEYARTEAIEGEVSVDVTVSDGYSRNTIGTVGPDTEEEVLVGAHVDGHDISEGALDNASGVAVLAEVARALVRIEDDLETRVRLVGFGAEELGLVGSQTYADEHDLSGIGLVVNCDGAGRARDMAVRTCGFEGVPELVEATSEEYDHPIDRIPGVNPHSDHWPFVWRGIPGIQVRSITGEGRGFGHTFADTFDKTDARAVREHAILTTALVERAARSGTEIEPRSVESIQEELERKELDISMRVAGDWPYE
jgi:Zn-dependent M28 family amino/carboxypeptidase